MTSFSLCTMPTCEDYPQNSSPIPRQPAKRTRTRTGCYTCRRRKVREIWRYQSLPYLLTKTIEALRRTSAYLWSLVGHTYTTIPASDLYHCSNRLGVPCVFPQLFLNSAGKLVASPQPNGKTRKGGCRKSQKLLIVRRYVV